MPFNSIAAKLHSSFGNSLLKRGRLAQAEAAQRHAIALDPKHPRGHIQLSYVLNLQGRLDEAIHSAHRAIELDPTNPESHRILGTFLVAKGDMTHAEVALNHAIALDRERPEVYIQLSHALNRQGRLGDAIIAARRAVELNPSDPDPYHTFGKLLFFVGDLKQAEFMQRKTIELDSKHLDARKALLPILFARNESKEFDAVLDLVGNIERLTLPDSLRSGLLEIPVGRRSNAFAPSDDFATDASAIVKSDAVSSPAMEQRWLWADQAGELLTRWVLFNPAKMQEVDEVSDYPYFAASLANGTGAILVGTHCGPPVMAANHIANHFSASKIVTGNAWRLFNLPRRKVVILNCTNLKLFLLEILRYLREGNVVFWLGDTAYPANSPTLAYYSGAPIYWYAALWRDGRIVHQIEPGPRVVEGESLDDWLGRWFAFYAEKYFEMLLSDAANIRRNKINIDLMRIYRNARNPIDSAQEYFAQSQFFAPPVDRLVD